MPEFWIRETRISRDEPGVTVVIGSDDPVRDGEVVRFDDVEKFHGRGVLETRLGGLLKTRAVAGERVEVREGGPSGRRRPV